MAQICLMSIRLIGVVHKEKSKMYMTSVLWSDHNDIIVYRGFQDFKKLHKQMKKVFPPANPLKKSDRIIPKFRDKKIKGAQKKSPSKSVLRLKSLEKYCSELLGCDPRVPQNQELIQFFLPKNQDLQPEFAKNSIVILPSEDKMGGDSSGHEKKVNVGNVTQPLVTETHRCVAPYETKDTKNRPFKVALDESVDVLIKDKAGWWLVENEDKRLAWFPAPYLEKMEDDDENDRPGICGENVTYCAVKNYKATDGDEVSLNIGSVVEVLQKSDNGWWFIRYRGAVGYVPAMYLQPYNNPRVRLMGLHQNLHRSNLNLASLGARGRSNELGRSQGNLLQPSGLHPSSANQLHPADKHKSRSLNVLSEPLPEARPEPGVGAILASPSNTVEDGGVDGDGRRRSLTGGDREVSLSSEGSDSGFSDLSSSSGGSSPSRTPPPMAEEPKMTPSNHNLFKAPVVPKVPPKAPVVPKVPPKAPVVPKVPPKAPVVPKVPPKAPVVPKVPPKTPVVPKVPPKAPVVPKVPPKAPVVPKVPPKVPVVPKVPPRPRAQEILARCSTVTRRKAAKAELSASAAQITMVA